jgi:Na+/H+ antiporter NhaA
VDDLVAQLVIATVYSGPVSPRPLLLALGVFGGMLLLRRARIRYGLLYFLLGAAAWVAVQASGVEPVMLGLAVGLLTSAYAPTRGELERASDLFRLFREQPTPRKWGSYPRLGHRDRHRHCLSARRLALVGPATSTQLRVFLLTLAVVDDIAAVTIIGVLYS